MKDKFVNGVLVYDIQMTKLTSKQTSLIAELLSQLKITHPKQAETLEIINENCSKGIPNILVSLCASTFVS